MCFGVPRGTDVAVLHIDSGTMNDCRQRAVMVSDAQRFGLTRATGRLSFSLSVMS